VVVNEIAYTSLTGRGLASSRANLSGRLLRGKWQTPSSARPARDEPAVVRPRQFALANQQPRASRCTESCNVWCCAAL